MRTVVARIGSIAALVLVAADAVASGPVIVTPPGPNSASERQALIAAIELLPKAPVTVAVMDVGPARDGVREYLLTLDVFIVRGNTVIYVVQQSGLLRRAREGSAAHRAMLAAVVWHEMSHLTGADEPHARQAEEDLWTRFVRDNVIDQLTALSWLRALKTRPDDQLLVSR